MNLIQLNSKIDRLIRFEEVEEKKPSTLPRELAVGATGSLIAAGIWDAASRLRRKLRKR